MQTLKRKTPTFCKGRKGKTIKGLDLEQTKQALSFKAFWENRKRESV